MVKMIAKLFSTVIISFFWTSVFCQMDNTMTGYPKYLVKENLKKYLTRNNFKNSVIQETDTTLLLSIRDTAFLANDFYYHFDFAAICDEEKKLSKCSGCLTDYLNEILSDSAEYKWNKINDHLYLSKFSKKRIVEVVDDGASCPYIRITKLDWNRKEYKKYLSLVGVAPAGTQY